MIISLSGPPGSGKSTVAKLLSEKLNWDHEYVGGLRRKAAAERGLTIEEYNKLGETDPSTDTEVDNFQKELGLKRDNFVIEGRTSFYFIPHSFKVYVDVSLEEAARRMINVSSEELKERNEIISASLIAQVEKIKERMDSDRNRYSKFYPDMGDCYDKNNFDLVIDSTDLTPEEVFNQIYAHVKAKLEE